jgi:predicted dehydrogenase
VTGRAPVNGRDLRAAVIGVGSFGRHHARIYGELAGSGVRLVGLVDIDPEGPRALADRLGVPLVARLEDLPEPVDVVSVAVPTTDHRAVAEPLLRRGVHCIVEKPLAGSSADAQALMGAAEAGGALLQVGLVERFNPVMAALDRLGAPPAFLEVHRLAPFPSRSADIGVVMDMMIHDLDLVNHLVGEEAERVEAVGVPVLSRHEDIANARLVFPCGCVANVTASRISSHRMRRFRVFSTEGYLSLDYDKREALLVRPPPPGARVPEGGDVSDLLVVEKLPIEDAEPLREEITALVSAVRTGRRARVGGGEGLRALRVAERILADLERRAASAGWSRSPLQHAEQPRLRDSAPP